MGIGQMTGSPWHIEILSTGESGPRRHKSHCIFYNKATKRCSKIVDKCFGSSHCEYYRENTGKPQKKVIRDIKVPTKDTLPKHKAITITRDKKNKFKHNVESVDKTNYCDYYPVGCNVYNEKFGKGVVKNHDMGLIAITFANGTEKRFVPKICYINKLFEVIE